MVHVQEIGSRKLLNAIAAAKQRFGAGLMAAPGFEILMALHAAECEGESVTVGQLAARLALSATTTARFVTVMRSQGMVEVEEQRAPCEPSLRISRDAELAVGEILRGLDS